MPTDLDRNEVPVVTFDALTETSPFLLLKRLKSDTPPALVDVRPTPSKWTLENATHQPDPRWEPDDENAQVILFDEDGTIAVQRARELQSRGFPGVRALFGGLDLYEFSLDPEIVEQHTFLVPTK